MKKILIFDVNETLLDLSALDTDFEKLFGDAAVRKEWFAQFIQSAFVTIITEAYQPFGVIGSAAFEMVAEQHNIQISDDDKYALLAKLIELPVHPEVPSAMKRLKDEGYVIAALTNSIQEVAEKQLSNAGIEQYFDKILSADAVQTLKPSSTSYEYAAHIFRTDTSGLRLVASHAWDIAGAMHAGCSAAFIARPGAVLDPLFDEPTVIGKDLSEVAQKIMQEDK